MIRRGSSLYGRSNGRSYDLATGRTRLAKAPWWVLPLLRLTTARFEADASIDQRIAARLERLRAAGWTVRMGGPRNYIAWHNARILSGPVPAIVLPNGDFPFTRDERNVAILQDVVVAELRVRLGRALVEGDPRFTLMLAVAKAIFPEDNIDERRLRGLLGRIEVKTQNALVDSSFDVQRG